MSMLYLSTSFGLGALAFSLSYWALLQLFEQVCSAYYAPNCAPVGTFSSALSIATFVGMIYYYSKVGFKFESKKDEPIALMWLVLVLMTISRSQVFWW
ncbi:hypothetical protein B9G98_03499 [Wickerhamiella sorbophila]|uniref:Uncharacterized protein n=1 Tax=Wickerhamiella sorbophila TaxID=45607 RepID=A0A2T0FLL8_9ASCO|nr:hypothetical protein B9G98_03499 [Wickerhamiella sorbophila]PRT55879.1 hypothetical protein B9G98_03499 [Wickerhamiella sorbophila]